MAPAGRQGRRREPRHRGPRHRAGRTACSRRCSAADRPRTGCPGPRQPGLGSAARRRGREPLRRGGTRAATREELSSSMTSPARGSPASRRPGWPSWPPAARGRSRRQSPGGRPSSRAHRRGTADRWPRAPAGSTPGRRTRTGPARRGPWRGPGLTGDLLGLVRRRRGHLLRIVLRVARDRGRLVLGDVPGLGVVVPVPGLVPRCGGWVMARPFLSGMPRPRRVEGAAWGCAPLTL